MHRRTLFVLALGLALATGAPPGGATTAAAQDAARFERAAAELPPDAARTLEQTVADARERGLPTGPIIDKTLEGTAKGVPTDRILAVVDGLVGQLDRAQGLLGNGSPPAGSDVAAVADALGRGVPESAVRELRATDSGEAPVALAAHTVADLLDRGVPVESALDVLEAWRSRGAGPGAEMRELPAAVERLIRQGVLPDQAAASVAAAVRAGRPPGTAGPPSPGRRGPPGAGQGRGRPDGPPIPPGAGPPAGRGPGSGNGPGSGSGNGSGSGSGGGSGSGS